MAKKTILSFLRDQTCKVPPVVSADLKGKTAVVVGANTGLGFEAAKHFARMGADRLILACRNQDKGEVAVQRLEEATGYSKGELWLVDLAEFASVRAFADRVLKELERLDILLLNAAVVLKGPQYAPTVDGWEQALQVNDLSLSLIAILLLPQMLETAKQNQTIPRMVVVSSELHYWAHIEDKVLNSPNAFEVLGSQEYCTPKILKSRYFVSKLLNVFFVRALNNRLKDGFVIVNAVNPGLCYSGIRREITNIILRIVEILLARQTEEGSRQLVWAAVGTPEGGADKLRGAYVNLSSIDEPGDFVLGEEGEKKEQKLWDDLIFVLRKADPRVTDIVSRHLATT